MDKTILEAAKLLTTVQTIVIATHVMPDGDGLGAEIALYHYLQRMGKNVKIMNPDVTPERYLFLDKTNVIENVSDKNLNLSPYNKKFDLAIIVDTHDPKRIGNVWNYFEKIANDILIFDHHPQLHRNDIPKNLRVHIVVDERSSSIGELLFRLFNQGHDFLDSTHPSFRLSPEIALGLYVSILTDTNSFRYAKTTALSHRIAADLIDYGLDPETIYQNIYSSKSIEHLRLIGEVLKGVQCRLNGRYAWVEITRAMRHKYAALSDDTQSILNYLLLIKDAEVIALLREEDDGRIKVSLKSKGKIQVNLIAQEMGGGGHDYAAGFVSTQKISQVSKVLISRFEEKFKS